MLARDRSARESLPPRGEPYDVAAIYLEYRGFVWRSLRHLGVSSSDLDDVLQEVFVVAHRRRASFDGTSTVRSWLFGIARMQVLSLRKRAYRRRERLVEQIPDEPADADPERDTARARRFARALELLSHLDEDKRVVFLLYEIEEMTMAEVSNALGIKLQTAYSRLYRARELLRSAARAERQRGGAHGR